jgi:hypothetical protein
MYQSPSSITAAMSIVAKVAGFGVGDFDELSMDCKCGTDNTQKLKNTLKSIMAKSLSIIFFF